MPLVPPARTAIVLAKTLRVVMEAARAYRLLRIIFFLLKSRGGIAVAGPLYPGPDTAS